MEIKNIKFSLPVGLTKPLIAINKNQVNYSSNMINDTKMIT